MDILVVDDQDCSRLLLKRLLEEQGFRVFEASSGEDAIACALKDKLDVVLMDVMMPGMSGFEATRKIKSQLTHEHLPIIFLTALGSEDELADALAVGGDDFLVKPFQPEILYAKLKAHGRIKHLHAEVSQKNDELRGYKDVMDEERDIAKHVFNSALSKNCLDLPHIESFVSPTTTFNGDLLLGMSGPIGNYYTLMADFTGHGLPAAIGAIPLSQAFFKQAKQGSSIGDMALHLNELLRELLPSNMFCAAILIEQSNTGEHFTIWSGGVPVCFVLDMNGSVKSELETLHMPLGVLENHEFERDVHMLRLAPGESIITYTDGLTEAENAAGIMYGEDRLLSVLNDPDITSVDDIIHSHAQFMGEQKPEDDITVLKIFAGPMQLPDMHRSLPIEEDLLPWDLNCVLDRDTLARDLPIPAQLISMLGAETKLAEHKDFLYTIFAEFYSNALEHGILGLSSSLKNTEDGYEAYYARRAEGLEALPEDALIQVSLRFIPGHPNQLCVMFKDSGGGFDYEKLDRHAPVPIEDDRSYGRGLDLIDSLCASLVYSEGGTRVDAVYHV